MSAINVTKHNFHSEILSSEKRVLLDFFAPWCGPCRTVLPIVDGIAREREDIRVGKINVTEEPELAGAFGVMSVPTLVVLEDGKVISRTVGMKSRGAILEMLEG